MKVKMEDIHCKVPASLKRKARRVFDKLGTNQTDAIRMFLAQVAMRQAIPFEISIPNKATLEAIEEAKDVDSLESYSSAKEMFEALDKDEE